MALSVRVVPFGSQASGALYDEVAAAKGDDPLAPVSVVVPRSITGLAVRRLLASGDLGPSPSAHPSPTRVGIANVRFTTLARLVEEVAGPTLAAGGALPATSAVLQAAARRALAHTTHDLFRPVRHHPGTARSLVAAYQDLRGASPASRSRLAGCSPRAAGVVALVEHMEESLGGRWYDEGRRIDVAIEVLSSPDALSALSTVPGAVLVYLPLRLGAPDERFLAGLAAHCPVTVLVGVTGEPLADTTSWEIAARLGPIEPVGASGSWSVLPGDAPVVPGRPMVGTAVVSAPTADAEVRLAVREVMRRRRTGTRFERMAIVHGGTGPYERLVRETLDSAGIPCNRVSTRPLAATFAGRTLLRAFELDDRGWRRDEVMSWVAGGPIRGADGSPVPAVAWDLLSRDAGITSGLDGWRRHLQAYADDRAGRLGDLDGPAGIDAPASIGDRLRRQLRESRALGDFIDTLAAHLDSTPSTWSGWAAWATAVLDDYLGQPTGRDPWPTEEEEALGAVRSTLEGLTVLDHLDHAEAAPDRTVFRQALVSGLEAPAPQTSRFGAGVLVYPVGLLVGLDLDVVFVVGMVDGAFPTRDGDDALLPDAERRVAGESIPLRGGRRHDAHRDFLAALAAAPERILSYARGDQRRGRQQRPARWLLDTLGALEGSDRRLFSRDVDDLGQVPGYRVVPSFTDAVRSDGEPMSLADRDLRSLLRWWDAGHQVADHYLADLLPVLHAGLEARRQRRSHHFGRFDGRVDRDDIPSPTGGGALSPTGLETFAACPRHYLMERVLRIEERERPEDILDMSPSDRGTLVHAVLERFIAGQLELPRDRRIQPGIAWSGASHARIDRIADAVFGEFEDQGLIGHRQVWNLKKATIRRELHRFLVADDEYRRRWGLVPERVELQFGAGHGAPVELRLARGRSITFKGSIDRVDLADDGSISLIDYKTGSRRGFEGVADDALQRGQRLQLPLYGLAARRALGGQQVRMAYWFVSEKGGFTLVDSVLDARLVDRFGNVVTVLVDGIEAGLFAARPGPNDSNCQFCPFTAMCPGDRHRSWERVKGAPELAAYVALAEGTDGSGADDGVEGVG